VTYSTPCKEHILAHPNIAHHASVYSAYGTETDGALPCLGILLIQYVILLVRPPRLLIVQPRDQFGRLKTSGVCIISTLCLNSAIYG
jgi:hypothetical protein